MENVHPANHGRFVHKRKVVYCPRNASNLCIDLDQDLVDDRPQILTLGDGVAEDNLGWDWEFRQEESLDVIIEGVLSFCSWQKQHYSLDRWVQLGLEFSGPSACVHATLDLEDFRLCALVAELLEHLLHG